MVSTPPAELTPLWSRGNDSDCQAKRTCNATIVTEKHTPACCNNAGQDDIRRCLGVYVDDPSCSALDVSCASNIAGRHIVLANAGAFHRIQRLLEDLNPGVHILSHQFQVHLLCADLTRPLHQSLNSKGCIGFGAITTQSACCLQLNAELEGHVARSRSV